jgi:hypothetical protein
MMAIVIEQTAETFDSPAEFLARMRAVERDLQRLDAHIESLRAEVKAARSAREKTVAELRQLAREAKLAARAAAANKDTKKKGKG